jgi:hypothetical protein
MPAKRAIQCPLKRDNAGSSTDRAAGQVFRAALPLRRPPVTFKTFLLALVAAAALIGAAIIGVPSTVQKASELTQFTIQLG